MGTLSSMISNYTGTTVTSTSLKKATTSSDEKDAGTQMLGNGIIIIAQIVTAIQMVIEEKFVGGQNVPALQAVGWEGCWGLCFISVVLVAMYFIPDDSHKTGKFEDSYDAMTQISNSWKIALATCGNVMSIAFFNFFGISVTKAMSAAHRMVIDSVRTFVIWGCSLALGWEKFAPLQLVGFAVLLAGTVYYQEIFKLPGGDEFWGYTCEADDLAGILQDDDNECGLKSPIGGGKHSKSFTTVDDAKRGSVLSASSKLTGDQRSSHIGSFTGS